MGRFLAATSDHVAKGAGNTRIRIYRSGKIAQNMPSPNIIRKNIIRVKKCEINRRRSRMRIERLPVAMVPDFSAMSVINHSICLKEEQE